MLVVSNDTCLTADHFDAARGGFKALLIHLQPTMRVQVTGRGHHDPGDPTERHLAEALLAAMLEESFTLDRVRRDRVEHDVRASRGSHSPRRRLRGDGRPPCAETRGA